MDKFIKALVEKFNLRIIIISALLGFITYCIFPITKFVDISIFGNIEIFPIGWGIYSSIFLLLFSFIVGLVKTKRNSKKLSKYKMS